MFRAWLEQDYLFLLDYVRVFSRLAWQAPAAFTAWLVALVVDPALIVPHWAGFLLRHTPRRSRNRFLVRCDLLHNHRSQMGERNKGS